MIKIQFVVVTCKEPVVKDLEESKPNLTDLDKARAINLKHFAVYHLTRPPFYPPPPTTTTITPHHSRMEKLPDRFQAEEFLCRLLMCGIMPWLILILLLFFNIPAEAYLLFILSVFIMYLHERSERSTKRACTVNTASVSLIVAALVALLVLQSLPPKNIPRWIELTGTVILLLQWSRKLSQLRRPQKKSKGDESDQMELANVSTAASDEAGAEVNEEKEGPKSCATKLSFCCCCGGFSLLAFFFIITSMLITAETKLRVWNYYKSGDVDFDWTPSRPSNFYTCTNSLSSNSLIGECYAQANKRSHSVCGRFHTVCVAPPLFTPSSPFVHTYL